MVAIGRRHTHGYIDLRSFGGDCGHGDWLVSYGEEECQLKNSCFDCIAGRTYIFAAANDRNTQLEAEIQRLRKIPLTQPQEKRDDLTIKAKSSADVRRLTEAAFGLQPEIGASNEDE